jgi:hypothetical protein
VEGRARSRVPDVVSRPVALVAMRSRDAAPRSTPRHHRAPTDASPAAFRCFPLPILTHYT